MALTASQLNDLRAKLKLLLGDSELIWSDAFTIYDDQSTNATSSTVGVVGTTLTLIGNAGGTDAFDLTNASYDTLEELTDAITALGEGHIVTLLYSGDADSQYLDDYPTTSILGADNTQTLRIENTERLNLLIEQAYAGLNSALNYEVLSQDYTGYYPLGRCVVFEEPQLTRVKRVMADVETGLTVKYTGTDTNATVEVTSTAVYCTSRAGATTTENEVTFAANVTTTALATAITALSGWEATVNQAAPSGYLIATGAIGCKDSEVGLEVWCESVEDHHTDFEAGTLEFDCLPPWNRRGQMRVDYTAGYASIPDDLEGVILEVAKGLHEAARKDSSVIEERLGDYAYKLGDSNEAKRVIARIQTDYATILQRYARWLP